MLNTTTIILSALLTVIGAVVIRDILRQGKVTPKNDLGPPRPVLRWKDLEEVASNSKIPAKTSSSSSGISWQDLGPDDLTNAARLASERKAAVDRDNARIAATPPPLASLLAAQSKARGR